MPGRRSTHQEEQQSQRLPPPPYDGCQSGAGPSSVWLGSRHAEMVSPVFERVGHQTVPKTSEVQMTLDASPGRSFEDSEDKKWAPHNDHRFVINDQEQQPTQSGQRRRSIDQRRRSSDLRGGRAGNNEFVDSITVSSPSLFRYITIEPFAFLAIMSVYLEFPAIQDLIYTKICLDVVSAHPNMANPSQAAQSHISNTGGSQANGTFVSNATLPSNGRIQQLIDSANQSSQVNTTSLVSSNQPSLIINTDHRTICDRLNKAAVPLEIRQEITDNNSLFWLKYQILICLLCALANPYWGGVSDRIGRVLPLNVPIFASILSNSISLAFGLLISLDSHAVINIDWLYVGAVLVGLSGGQLVLIMNSFGFISDNTTSEERLKRVTVLESVIFVAHSVGFFLSRLIMPLGLVGPNGMWLNRHSVSFSACILINLLCIMYSSCRLRHHKFHRFLNNFEREKQEATNFAADHLGGSASTTTLDAKDNGDTSMAQFDGPSGSCDRLRELTSSTPDDPDGPIGRADKSNWSVRDTLITFKYYKETYEIATKPRETRSIILLLLFLGFLSALSLATLMSLFFIYVKMDPFNWPTSQYSSWNANSSITRGFALICLTLLMKFVPAWQVPDALVAAVGFVAKGAGLLMIGLAQSSALINWSLIAFTFSEFSMPPIRSLLSKLVPKEELCKVYSCLGTLQSLCFIVGNVAFYLAFTSFMQRDLFKFTFIGVGAIEIGAVVIVLLVYSAIKRQILLT